MLDGAARVEALVAKAAADGQPALGITDHGNMYGVLDFYQACRKQGITPVIGTELYQAYEHRTERPARRGRVDDSGGDSEGGRKALLPPDGAGRERDRLPQPDPALQPGVPGGLLHEAQGRLGAARGPPRGPDRDHRVPGWPGAPGPAQGRRGRGPRQGGPPPGHLRARQPVHRAPGPGDTRAAADQPEAVGDRPQDRGAAAGHQRQPLHRPGRPRGPRRPAVRADRRADERPRPLQVPWRPALPEDGQRDAGRLRRGARGLRQHVVDRRAGQRRDQLRQAPAARLPHPRGLRRLGRLPRAPHLHRGTPALGRSAHR